VTPRLAVPELQFLCAEDAADGGLLIMRGAVRRSSPLLLLLVLLAAVLAATLPAAAATPSGRGEAQTPTVTDLHASARRIHLSDLSQLSFTWHVRYPHTVALVLNRWQRGTGWVPRGTYVQALYRDGATTADVDGSATFKQVIDRGDAPQTGLWRAMVWASVGEADGGSASANRELRFVVVP
jgi:hypothetical protein